MSQSNPAEDSDDVEFIDLENANIDENNKNSPSPKHSTKSIENKPKIKNSPFRNMYKMQGHSISRQEKNSRRKATHTVINENDEILFESYPKLTDLSKKPNEQSIKKMPKLVPCKMQLYKKKDKKHRSKNGSHPALEHMQRIAFLKACINFMLISVGKDTINFDKTGITLSKLVNLYNKISPTEIEVIGISD